MYNMFIYDNDKNLIETFENVKHDHKQILLSTIGIHFNLSHSHVNLVSIKNIPNTNTKEMISYKCSNLKYTVLGSIFYYEII